jgi:hypothetical protein
MLLVVVAGVNVDAESLTLVRPARLMIVINILSVTLNNATLNPVNCLVQSVNGVPGAIAMSHVALVSKPARVTS